MTRNKQQLGRQLHATPNGRSGRVDRQKGSGAQTAPPIMIALAWPDTKVLGTGELYDRVSLKILRKERLHYRVGHAALIVAKFASNEFFYFDFGRYETEEGYGRIRDAKSDPELTIFKSSEISTPHQLLEHVSKNKNTHGHGRLLATIVDHVDSQKLEQVVQKIHQHRVHRYSPFKGDAINCSRFVHMMINSCTGSARRDILLKVLPMRFFTTGFYIKVLSFLHSSHVIEIASEQDALEQAQPEEVPGYQPLRGIGSSAWFKICEAKEVGLYRIERKNEFGETTFDALFELTSSIQPFETSSKYKILPYSSALCCTVEQSGLIFEFRGID
ncbi:MAG: hypothetical protein KTR24_18205 [Saprospiraceae bacterium]|nr:hypothetical protein [Saprospiraceae bacterium]